MEIIEGPGTLFLMILLIHAGIFGTLSSWVAGEKGRSEGAWLLLGALLGIVALVALAAVPPLVKAPGISLSCSRCGTRLDDAYRRPDGRYDCPSCRQPTDGVYS